MIEAQKQLLASLEAAEESAVALYVRGVKLAGVVQKIRAARQELEARVRALEKSAPPADALARKPKPAKSRSSAGLTTPHARRQPPLRRRALEP